MRMWAKRLELVRRVGHGARVLDIGAGIGTFLALGRARFGWDVTGTEVSTSAVKLARERFQFELQLGLEELDDSQDAAIELSLALTPEERFDRLVGWAQFLAEARERLRAA